MKDMKVFERKCVISLLCQRIKSPLSVGLLCLFFLTPSFLIGPVRCNASDMAKKHGNQSHILPSTILNQLSVPQKPLTGGCECPHQGLSCCKFLFDTTPNKAYLSPFSGNNLRQFPTVQPAVMLDSSIRTGLREKVTSANHMDYAPPGDVFIVNCSFLI